MAVGLAQQEEEEEVGWRRIEGVPLMDLQA